MDITTVTAFMNDNKGEAIVVTLVDGTTLMGTAVSVNSKGVNIKTAEGKTVARPVAKIQALDVAGVDDELTTAEMAAIFDTNAKALRVVLRKMDLGVGKGKRYTLHRSDVPAIREAYTAHLATEAAKTQAS